MPGLWLPRYVIQERKTELAEMERRDRYVPPPKSQLELDCEKLLWVIGKGDAEWAGRLAREIATYVYDNRLDRNFCEDTGFPYFHSCDDY